MTEAKQVPDNGSALVDQIARAEIAGIKDDVARLVRSVDSLRDTMAEGRRPQWQALGVLLMAILAIGGFAYWPIRETLSDLKTAFTSNSDTLNKLMIALPDKFVTVREHDRLLSRTELLMPRMEFEKVLADRDNRISGAVRRIERLEVLTGGRNVRPRIQGDPVD